MIHKLISSVALAGLASTVSAEEATKNPAAESAAATTPPIEVSTKTVDPADVKTRASYALGFRTGGEFSRKYGRFGILDTDLEADEFLDGFMTALKGGDSKLDEKSIQEAMVALGNLLEKREKELAEKNLEEGKKFLEANGKREGVITTDSGLQYEVLKEGGDEKYVAPKEGERKNHQFLVHYKGSLIDGTEFDASPEGQPVPMTLQVVPGFKEALMTMPVGAKWKLYLPSDLAYGSQRRSAEIGPNSVLVFELELVEIREMEVPQAAVRPATPQRAVSKPVRVPPMPEKAGGERAEEAGKE